LITTKPDEHAVDYGALQAFVPGKQGTQIPELTTYPLLQPVATVALEHEAALDGHYTQEVVELTVIDEYPVEHAVIEVALEQVAIPVAHPTQALFDK